MVIRGASHDVVVVTTPLKAIQLLRLKCEAYTTMNDVDEDTEGYRAPPHVRPIIVEVVDAMMIKLPLKLSSQPMKRMITT